MTARNFFERWSLGKRWSLLTTLKKSHVSAGIYVATSCSIRLRKSTAAKLHQFTESDNDQLHKIREDISGRPCCVFKRKAVLNESLFRIQQTGGEPMLEPLIVSSVRILCVRRWLLDFMKTSTLEKDEKLWKRWWFHSLGRWDTMWSGEHLHYVHTVKKWWL